MPWVSYQKIREEVSIAEVIADYGLELRGSGDQRKCMCPAPNCRDPEDRSLSVNVAEGVFKCWKCDVKGNIIDFVALIEDLDPLDTKQFRKAALMIQEKYQVESKRPENPSRTDTKGKVHRRAPVSRPEGTRRKILVNEPLDFELKSLDPEHDAVKGLGLKPETVEAFGIGFSERRGLLQGRIAFPLHDGNGQLVGYAGRMCDPADAGEDVPLYRYPDAERIRKKDQAVLRFDLSRVIYNAHRFTEPVQDLYVVELPEFVWYLHEAGYPNVVAVLGQATEDQRKLVADLLKPDGEAWYLAAGQDARASMSQVARTHAVHWFRAGDLDTVLRYAPVILSDER